MTSLPITTPYLAASHLPSYLGTSDSASSHNALLQHMALLEQSTTPSPLATGEYVLLNDMNQSLMLLQSNSHTL